MIKIDFGLAMQILVTIFVYVSFCHIQRIVFKGSYFSVQDIVLSANYKKAVLALISRFIYVVIVHTLLIKILGFKEQALLMGVVLGSFLLTWPSIYFYRLFFHHRNPVKRYYFWGCIFSMLITFSSSLLTTHWLLPIIFEGKHIEVFSNDGLQFLLSISAIVFPYSISRWLRDSADTQSFKNEPDTFEGDLCILENRLRIERPVIEDYSKYIEDSAKKYNINKELLMIVLLVEYINRSSFTGRVLERMIAVLFPALAIKLDLSLGMAQLKISTIKKLTNEPNRIILREIFNEKYNIEMCALYLSKLIEAFESSDPIFDDENEEMPSSVFAAEDVYEYIVAKYLSGSTVSWQRFFIVYATVLRMKVPNIHYSPNPRSFA